MHYVRIVLASKNIAGATHICGKLIDLIESAVYDSPAKSLIPQVTHHEIVSSRIREVVKFQIYPANPKSIVLQPFDQMAADEPTGPADQRTFCHQPASPSQYRDFPTGTSQIISPEVPQDCCKRCISNVTVGEIAS